MSMSMLFLPYQYSKDVFQKNQIGGARADRSVALIYNPHRVVEATNNRAISE